MDLNKYQEFVNSVTSKEANHYEAFIKRLEELHKLSSVNLPLLLNSAAGLAAEAGEFSEIPKKVFWQGKPLDEATQFHMKRELGDIMWYWMNACRALNITPEEVIQENIDKLNSRYTDGAFKAEHSETRKKGDI